MNIIFPLILDGATGTELQKRGYKGDVSAEQWVLDNPESIVEIQKNYVAAGSNVLYSPSFGANRRKLEEHGIFNKTADYNRRLAALSQKARRSSPAIFRPRDCFFRRWVKLRSRSLWIFTPSRQQVLRRRESIFSSSRP